MFPSEQKRLDAARAILGLIRLHAEANLSAELWDGSVIPLGPSARADVRLCIRSGAAFRRLLLSPNLMTVYEQFAAGDLDIVGASPLEAADLWDHNKLLQLGRALDRKRLVALAWPFLLSGGSAASTAVATSSATAFKDNVPATPLAGRDDKAMIAFHYDVSNDFYALFLDPEMVYSCGYFPTAETSLEDAQIIKLDRICRKLRVAPGDRLLDIGCGWGGLMCHAATKFGAIVHGVTLSKEQFDFCAAKISALGLADRITLELRDYRTIEGKAIYDRVAQIEMFEHVGLDNHEAHFRTVHRLLRPRGTYLHQASTRRATLNPADFRKETSYVKVIRRYIFPGGDLDHIGMSTTNLERYGFEVHDIESMREHFALTLRHWEKRLYARRADGWHLAGKDRTRLWLIYFAMFAKSFERGTNSVFQTVATRRYSGGSGLPLGRLA
jgi:cyclopropane-fatty-acyl-phospholipid synthase